MKSSMILLIVILERHIGVTQLGDALEIMVLEKDEE